MLIRLSGSNGPNNMPPRSRAQTLALAAVALAAGALLLAFGLIILAGLAVTGTVVGGGIMLYHRITGRWPRSLHVTTYVGTIGDQRANRGAVPGLDPSREVFPVSREARALPGNDDPTSRG